MYYNISGRTQNFQGWVKPKILFSKIFITFLVPNPYVRYVLKYQIKHFKSSSSSSSSMFVPDLEGYGFPFLKRLINDLNNTKLLKKSFEVLDLETLSIIFCWMLTFINTRRPIWSVMIFCCSKQWQESCSVIGSSRY